MLTKIQVFFVLFSVASLSRIASATGGLNGLPVLNGPISPVAGQLRGSKKRVGDFIHPGLWHTHDDLERIRQGVLNDVDPWKSAFSNFSTDTYSQSSVSHLTLGIF